MVQAYVLVKGHHQHVEKWANDLAAQWFPLFKDGKQTGEYYQMGVGPVQLYELRFPKEATQQAMAMIGHTTSGDYLLERYPILNIGSKSLRKIFGLKKFPEIKNHNPFMQPNPINKSVGVIPIGIKDDIIHEGVEQL